MELKQLILTKMWRPVNSVPKFWSLSIRSGCGRTVAHWLHKQEARQSFLLLLNSSKSDKNVETRKINKSADVISSFIQKEKTLHSTSFFNKADIFWKDNVQTNKNKLRRRQLPFITVRKA